MRSRVMNLAGPGRCAVILGFCSVLLACVTEGPESHQQFSGASNSGVTFREVMGDFCPPAQAMKGNC